MDTNLAWIMGLLISEGSVNSKNEIAVHMTDKDTVDRFERAIKKFSPKTHVCRTEREEHVDPRGWTAKYSYVASLCSLELRAVLKDFGLDHATALDKKIPWSILQSPRDVVIAFLSALFEGDGSAFAWKDRKDIKLGVAYYSVSEQLCSEVQVLLKKLDMFSVKQPRSSKLSERTQWMLRLNGPIAWKLFDELKIKKWQPLVDQIERQYEPKDVGIVFDKSRNKWKASYYLKGNWKYVGRYDTIAQARAELKKHQVPEHLKVVKVEKLKKKDHLYDYFLPVSHSFFGGAFRQHNSIPISVYENVVAGFAIVSANPIDNVKVLARQKLRKELGIDKETQLSKAQDETHHGNQAVLSGTAYYHFNHFAQYWERWKRIIRSRGDRRILEEVMGGPVPDDFDYRDYSVIRIPYSLLPKGFMDDKHVARARATVHNGIYLMEYSACFANDSNGFFKRSLIESCVCGDQSKFVFPSCGEVKFQGVTRGRSDCRYVMAIDPASESDNFSIVILEIWPDHRRIVYCWVTTKNKHREMVAKGYAQEQDFYAFCCRKIRDLMKCFHIERIALDSQGGGFAIEEGLHDPDKCQEGELPIWQIIDPLKEKITDGYVGLHILEMINFASAEWTAQANHGMRKDFEDKVLLFPFFDGLTIGEAIQQDKLSGRQFDTLEDCVMEIEELKDELASIVITQTAFGRDRWDTPEEKKPGGKKGRQRKDRYSALLMANMVARTIARTHVEPEYESTGGFAGTMPQSTELFRGPTTRGPAWWEEAMRDVYD